jgi:signal peptidase I
MNHSQTKNTGYPEPVITFPVKNGSELMLSGDALRSVLSDVLNKGMTFRFKARGNSMSPFIKDGDVLTICPKRTKLFAKGDVVAYNHHTLNKIVIHRIVGRKKDNYLLKGDNTAGDADVVDEKDILGYVLKVERNGTIALFGLGPERFLISLLNRLDLIVPLMRPLRKIFRPKPKRSLL